MNANDLLKLPNCLEVLNSIAALWGSRVCPPSWQKLGEKHIRAILLDAQLYRVEGKAMEIVTAALLGNEAEQDWRPAQAIAEDLYAL